MGTAKRALLKSLFTQSIPITFADLFALLQLVHSYIINVQACGKFAVVDGLSRPVAAYRQVYNEEEGLVKFIGAINAV